MITVSSSYAKYWGKQILSHGSESKAKDGEKRKRKRKKEDQKLVKNNGQLRVPNATSSAARKAARANNSNNPHQK